MVKTRELSAEELAIRIEREYDRALAWDSKNWKRCVDNWRMYWGIDNEKGFGQWPPEVAAQMIQQGRQVATFNLCRPTVDTIAGGICKAPFSFDFSPLDKEVDSLTYRIKDLQYQEEELMDWRSSELSLYLSGLTYQGNWEMFLSEEYTKKGSGQKNIGFRNMLPGTVRYDPQWKTERSKDCKKAWVDRWMSALEMLQLWGHDKKVHAGIIKAIALKKGGQLELERLVELNSVLGDEYGYNTGIIPYMGDETVWGSQYKVVMHYYMKKVKKQYEYCLTATGRVVIPSHLKDPAEKIQWLNANVPEWQPDAIFVDEDEEDVQFMAAICPGLMHAMLLCNGPTEVQCGRLQFFPWSAYRINGEIGGIIDSIKDMQTSVNYINSRLTYREQVEAGGGSQFVEEGAFINHAEYERYTKEKNNPAAVFKLKNGTLLRYPRGPAVPTQTSPYPRELLDRLNHIIEVMWAKVSKHHDVDQGIAEGGSAQSGYKFNLQKMQSDISKFTIYEGLRNFWNEVGEAYLYQAIQTHGNGIERTFYNARTKKSFTINKHEIKIDENGELMEVIIDDISKLKEIRHKVMVTESSDSPSRKIEVMQTSSTLLQSMDKQAKPITSQRLQTKLTLNTDVFNEEEKMELEEDAELELQVAREEMAARAAEARVRRIMAIQQANPQPQAPTHPITGQPMPQLGNGGMGGGGGNAVGGAPQVPAPMQPSIGYEEEGMEPMSAPQMEMAGV